MTGERGEAIISELMTARGWVMSKLTPDYGFDFLGQAVTFGKLTGELAFFQVKATDRVSKETRKDAQVHLPMAHVQFWAQVPIPAFLVLIEVPTRRIFLGRCQALATAHEIAASGSRRESKTTSLTLNETESDDAAEAGIRTYVHEYWAKWRKRRSGGIPVLPIFRIDVAPFVLYQQLQAVFGVERAGYLMSRYRDRSDSDP